MAKKLGKALVFTALASAITAGGVALYNKYKASSDDLDDDDFLDFDDESDDFDDDFDDESKNDSADRGYVSIPRENTSSNKKEDEGADKADKNEAEDTDDKDDKNEAEDADDKDDKNEADDADDKDDETKSKAEKKEGATNSSDYKVNVDVNIDTSGFSMEDEDADDEDTEV
jgi:hypothetical protein